MNTCKNKRLAIRQLVLTAVTAGILAISSVSAPAWAGGSIHVGGGYSSGYYGGHHGYRGHYGGGYHGHGDDAAVALFAGLLFGGLLGYAISEDRQYAAARSHYYQAPPPAHVHSYYYERPVQTVPAPAPAFAEPSGCLQTREYTTTINIDGKAKEAYGTRCLQADGTWLLGPPKLAPQF